MKRISDLKLTVKRAIQNRTPSSFAPILVASMGRSGSTLVYDALVAGMSQARFGAMWKPMRRLCRAPAFDLGEIQFATGVVYKTHAYPSEIRSFRLPKVIFVFSTPSDAVLSTLASASRLGNSWIVEHFDHLRANGSPDEIVSRDVLRFRDQLDAWLNACNLDVLAIRYDALWDHLNDLTQFAGFPISLPPRRDRTSGDVDQGTRNLVRANYKPLDDEFAALADIIWSGPQLSAHENTGPV